MWVLIATIISTGAYASKTTTQTAIQGFPTAQSCVDFGKRWMQITQDRVPSLGSTSLHYDCMKM